MLLGPRAVSTTLVVLLSSFLITCGKGDSKPTGSTPPTTPPTTVIQQPATPPSPDPYPGSRSCARLGPGTNPRECPRQSPTFLTNIDRALDELMRERAELFENIPEGFRVTSSGQFLVALLEKLDQQGLCAAFDGEEVAVKTNNDYNDQFHMITSGGILRRGDSSYRATCYPAAFPVGPEPPYPPSNGCPLPSSREITCARESSQYRGDVEASIDQVAREHPAVFDFNQRQPGTEWYKIVDNQRFISFMLDAMKAKGYCARHDGEEFVFKKGNKFSEHYDNETGEGFVRRGEGTYRSTCYPAAF